MARTNVPLIAGIADQLTQQYFADMGVPRSIGADPGRDHRQAPSRGPGTRADSRATRQGNVIHARTPTGGIVPSRRPSADEYDYEFLEPLLAKMDAVEEQLQEARAMRAQQNFQANLEQMLQGKMAQLVSARSGQSPLGDVTPIQQMSGIQQMSMALASATKWKTALPFSGTLPALTVTELKLQPQRWFYGTRVVVPESQSAGIFLQDVRVANTTQLISAGEISCETLGPGLFLEENLVTSVCPPAQSFSLFFRNSTNADQYLTPTYFGVASLNGEFGSFGG